MGDEIKLSLLDNSHAFLREAAAYALSARSDARKWQFAVLNLVQSLELSLKSLLFDIHPILIFDNIDNPRTTVSPLTAIARLSNPTIGKVNYSDDELSRINKAIQLRNQMTHSEFILRPEYATAKFFEVFAFVFYFQAKHLKTEIDSIIPHESLVELLAIGRGLKEVAEKARLRMQDEGIHPDLVLECPICANESFVVQDDINRCYTCRHSDEIIECKRCERFFFVWQMEEFSTSTDPEVPELRWKYPYKEACFECISIIKNDIEEQVIQRQYEDDEYWEMQKAYWYEQYGDR